MESTTEESPSHINIDHHHHHHRHPDDNSDDHDLLSSQLLSLRESYNTLQSKSSVLEENLLLLRNQRDDALGHNTELKSVIHEITRERDYLRGQIGQLETSSKEKEEWFVKRIDEASSSTQQLEMEVEFSRERIEKLQVEIKEINEKNGFLLKILDSLRPVKGSLVNIIVMGSLDDEKVTERLMDNEENSDQEVELDCESRAVWDDLKSIARLASEAESKVNEFKEMKLKEKRELENSVVSLTEENRDINSLLRVALVEKEAVEKSLNKLKGNSEQKRVALLQIAERGLQRVGFGFMMGSGSTEQSAESSLGVSSTTANPSNKSDTSECEEEVVSLASTVERIMKNLRLEISQLRRSLEESMSDTERLQSLTQKQEQEIAESALYIKVLEDRERVLAQNVEDLLVEIKETESDVARWREACELEVAAGKKEIEERDRLVAILKQELEKTKAALEISNGKLKLKDELAAAAMAAQAAAERSLQLADSRATGLRERIEELTRQLEEAESRERSRRKVRHICWPWRAIKAHVADSASDKIQNAKRMLPEMQALLHHNV